MKKTTSLHNIKNLLKRRLIITTLASIVVLGVMAGLGHLAVQKLGQINEIVSERALPLFESTLEFEVNIKGIVLGASKYAHQPVPAHLDRINDSYNDIQQVLPEIMRLEDMGHPVALQDLLRSLNHIYNTSLNIVQLTDDIEEIEQRADSLLNRIDILQESLMIADDSIIKEHIEIIRQVTFLKTILIRIQGYHSGHALADLDLISSKETLKPEQINSGIKREISILSEEIVNHYQKLRESSIQRDIELKNLFKLRNHTDYLLDDVIQPDAKQEVVGLLQTAKENIISNSYYFLLLAGVGISILLIFKFVTIREFIKILDKFFLVMEHLRQGDFSVRVDPYSDGTIATDVRKSLNYTLEKLQALTVAQPYTDILWKSTSGGLLMIDPNGKILRINDAMQKLLVVDNVSLKEKQLIDYFPSFELQVEGVDGVRTELISGHDETIPVIISVKPVFGGQDQSVLQGYFCAVTDLRHDIKTNQQLFEQAEGLRAVLDTVTDAIIVIDSDSKIIFSNAKTEQLFDYRNEHLLLEHLDLILPEWSYQVSDSDSTPQVSITRGRDRQGNSISLEVSVGALIWQGKRALVLAIQTSVESGKDRIRAFPG